MAVEYAYLTAAITIETGVNDDIYFQETPSGTYYTATIAAGTYFLFGHPTNSNSILKAIKTAMEAVGTGTYDWDSSGSPALVWDPDTFDTPGYASTGNVRWNYEVTSGPTGFTLLTAHANTTFDPSWIGLTATNQVSVGGVIQNDTSSPKVWIPNEPPARMDYKQHQDADINQVQTRDHTVINFQRSSTRHVAHFAWEFLTDASAQSDADLLESATGSFYEFWELNRTGKFRVYAGENDGSDTYTGDGSIVPYSDVAQTNVGRWWWAFDEQAVRSVPRARFSPGLSRYSLGFTALETT